MVSTILVVHACSITLASAMSGSKVRAAVFVTDNVCLSWVKPETGAWLYLGAYNIAPL